MLNKENEYNEDDFKRMLANNTLMKMKSELKDVNKYGVSRKYDRTKYDNQYMHKKFKEKYFNGKKTQKDIITGNTVHSNKKAAINKYGKKAYTNHTVDADHIVALEEVHEKYRKNPFLTDDDIKNLGNPKNYSNYMATTSKFNRSKQNKNNLSLALEKGRPLNERMILAGSYINASVKMEMSAAKYTVKNISDEVVETTRITLEEASIPMAVEGVYNLILVAEGEKDFSEAVVDMGMLAGTIVVKENIISIAGTGITNIMKNSANELFRNIANSNAISQLITVSAIVGNSVIKLINGEITGEQFFSEIGQQGIELIGGTIGAIAGEMLIPIPVVGAMIGSIVISGVCGMIYKGITTLNAYKEKEEKISRLAEEAISEMNRQNNIVKEIIKEQFNEWDNSFNKGFELIQKGAVGFDVETIASGLDIILNVFGEKVRFSSKKEFDKFFDDEKSVFSF